MSWSVSASGKAGHVAPEIARQVATVNLSDAGEMETVKNAGELINQTLGTFDQETLVNVAANGSMGFSEWGTKVGPYQTVSISIVPIHLSVSS